MPALPDATNILRCTYSGTYGGSKWANVFHLRFATGNPGQADLNSLATGLRNAWNTGIAPIVGSGCQLTNTTVVDLTSNTGLVGASSATATGTNAGTQALPANVALVISFKIARRYRGGHPRMYLTGMYGVNTANNTSWTAAFVTSAGTNAAAWLSACNALTFTSMPTLQVVNLSYYTNNVLRPSPVWDVIGSVQVHSRVDTMRRRLGKEIS